MASNYSRTLYNDFVEATTKVENLEGTINVLTRTIKELEDTIEKLNKKIETLTKQNEEKAKEILRLKSKNNKDSSNSSKPSGTNGFKKVITNRREKSTKKQGGQKGHKPHSLNNKLDQFINSGNIEEEVIEINKNEQNQNKRYIEKIVIDIKIVKTLKRYRYYPDEHGKYNIPTYHNQNVQYGPMIKAITTDLTTHLCNSTDGVTRFIEDITNGGITLSKGTLVNWTTSVSETLKAETDNIEAELLDSYCLNHDESQIKIDGDNYNTLCACNKTHTRLWASKHKSQEAIDQIGFLPKFNGVIVKDGTSLYNKYGIFLSQCMSHIQRYLKGIYDFIPHKAPKKMSNFLTKCNDRRNELIAKDIEAFTEEELNDLFAEYDSIIDEWERELRSDINNYLFDDEYKLWKRMKYTRDQDSNGDKNEILYFLTDFKVPATNNNAESSQRGVKIKQKIGKFRSVEGAENYLTIKSCILTYKKNKVNVLDALVKAFENNPVII